MEILHALSSINCHCLGIFSTISKCIFFKLPLPQGIAFALSHFYVIITCCQDLVLLHSDFSLEKETSSSFYCVSLQGLILRSCNSISSLVEEAKRANKTAQCYKEGSTLFGTIIRSIKDHNRTDYNRRNLWK